MILLKEVRRKLGLTQKQIADLLGTAQHRISEIERGVDGRKETRQMRHHLAALIVLGKHKLLDKLREML